MNSRTSHRKNRATGTAATAGTLALLLAAPLLAASPAAGSELPSGLRDIREFACPPGSVPDAGFSDVPTPDLYRLEINCLAELEVTQGTSDGLESRYNPAAAVPRYQMAVFVLRLLQDVVDANLPSPGTKPTFSDTDGLPLEAQTAIEKLTRAGIVQGTSATTFSPFRSVTREQMATFIANSQAFLATSGRYDDFPTADNPFPDVSGVHEASVAAVTAAGIAQGKTGGGFDPRGSITRGQMSAFLTRWVDVLDEQIPATSDLARDNEVFSDGIALLPPQVEGPAVVDQEGANNPTDDKVYIVGGLESGREYRVTLVNVDAYRRTAPTPDDGEDDDLIVFDGNLGTGLADPGTTSAVILEFDGEELDDPSRSATTVAGPSGGFEFRIDGDAAESIAPFVYPNQSYDYPSYDPRLELAADGRPVETFGVGPIATYTRVSS